MAESNESIELEKAWDPLIHSWSSLTLALESRSRILGVFSCLLTVCKRSLTEMGFKCRGDCESESDEESSAPDKIVSRT